MKKAILLSISLCLGALVYAEPTYLGKSSYYLVHSDLSPSHAQEVADKLDAYFLFYSRYFHFNPTQLDRKLTFKIFGQKSRFNDYLGDIGLTNRDTFVFLQYTSPEKNELVGFVGEDTEAFDSYMAHYSLIQYLKSFIPHPPIWMQLGFAIYFEKIRYIPDKKAIAYEENLDWLHPLKESFAGIGKDDHNLHVSELLRLLTQDPAAMGEDLVKVYARSWGLVYFLMTTEETSYNRILWDSLSLLEPTATREDNETAVMNSAFGWVTRKKILTDFALFIADTKTFPELVTQGRDYYIAQDYDRAEESFLDALELRKYEPAPFYYLGLIYYARKGYTNAKTYYVEALNRGAGEGLTYYAMGINAYAAGQMTDAKIYLQNSFKADPEGDYSKRAIDLLTRIEAQEVLGETES